jgi:phosphohistidine phosphatase
MNIYLLRHAKAVERGDPGYSTDSERPLTPDGKKKMRLIALGMKRLGLSLDLILSSPYVRARQTAEIAVQALGKTKRLKLSASLAAIADPAEIVAELNKSHRSCESIMLVGHEPNLSRLISKLVTGDLHLVMDFKKGGLAKITVGESLQYGQCACLDWILTPSQLCGLAA